MSFPSVSYPAGATAGTCGSLLRLEYDDETQACFLGDLFISVDSVRENASFYGTEFADELNRVIVHGLLHLIGYDDHTEEDIAVMRAKENYYLSQRGNV